MTSKRKKDDIKFAKLQPRIVDSLYLRWSTSPLEMCQLTCKFLPVLRFLGKWTLSFSPVRCLAKMDKDRILSGGNSSINIISISKRCIIRTICTIESVTSILPLSNHRLAIASREFNAKVLDLENGTEKTFGVNWPRSLCALGPDMIIGDNPCGSVIYNANNLDVHSARNDITDVISNGNNALFAMFRDGPIQSFEEDIPRCTLYDIGIHIVCIAVNSREFIISTTRGIFHFIFADGNWSRLVIQAAGPKNIYLDRKLAVLQYYRLAAYGVSNRSLRVYGIHTHELLGTLNTDQAVTCILPFGDLMLTGNGDGSISFYELIDP